MQQGPIGQARDQLCHRVAHVGSDTAARPPHGGVNLNVLVVTDGTPPVKAIGQQLTAEGMPTTVINLHDSVPAADHHPGVPRPHACPAAAMAATSRGSCCPAPPLRACPRPRKPRWPGTSARSGCARWTPTRRPCPTVGMNPPGLQRAAQWHSDRDQGRGQSRVRLPQRLVPVQRGAAGSAPFGYLADPVAGRRRHAAARRGDPGFAGRAALVWQYDHQGRQQLGIGFGVRHFQTQFHYLAHGIVTWVTRGVNLGNWRNYLDIAYDDMFLGDAQWSMTGHCTPGDSTCPQGHAGDRRRSG